MKKGRFKVEHLPGKYEGRTRYEGQSRDMTLATDGPGTLTGKGQEIKTKGADGRTRVWVTDVWYRTDIYYACPVS